MPFEIAPSIPEQQYVRPAHSQAFGNASWSWLASQDFDVNRAWQQQGSYRRGSLSGGPSYQRFLEFGNEQQWAIVKPRPVLTTPVLPDDQQFYRRQLGAVEWDSINPYNTLDQVADQTDMVAGDDPLKFLRGASDFLASKQIDIMGQGSTGAPARAADYALAFPIAIFNKMTGQRSDPANPVKDDNIYYAFQADPRYHQMIGTATPEQLHSLAIATASKYVDPSANGYFVDQLERQFALDRERDNAWTSGNEAIDYRAKKAAAGVAWSFGTGFTKIPVVGTQVGAFLDPITPEQEANWKAVDRNTRLALLNQYGMVQMATDFVSAMPALSGLGTVISVARGGGVVSRSLAQTYDWVLRGSGYVATAGLAAATTNWALEATWPGYSEFIGEDIDRARPISGSSLAGVVNTIGYWSTGTYGASNIVRGAVKGLSLAREAGAAVRAGAAAERGLVQPSSGMPEMTIFNVGHGGSRYNDILVGAGLDERGLALSQKRLVMSELIHLNRRPELDMWKAIEAGEPTGRLEIDMLPPEERLLAANDELRHSLNDSHHRAELAARVLAVARQPAELFRSDEGLRSFRWYKDNARTIDDEIAKRYIGEYGDAWIKRTAGATDEASIRTWVEQAVSRVGGDYSAIHGVRGAESWAKIMRSVHQYEFDYRNGELQAALAVPGLKGELPNEAGKLSIVSARHLFNDEAEASLAVLRGGDAAAARAEVNRLIDDTIEGERWFSNDWHPPRGMAHERELVKPDDMASWVEDVRSALLVRRGKPSPTGDTALLPLNALHQRLINDGVWDIAFKPVDSETGEFVSYVKTKRGVVFQTPWLDYPMGNVDNIELGNRGMAMAKYDSIFRGFRTWRVAEFQRGLLFRSLTGRVPGFTATQIDNFHTGVLQLARRFGVQPQTLGTVSQGLAGIGTAYDEAVNSLAHGIFGEGPYLSKSGEHIKIDWRKEIARSYRQSLRLNLTAGLTSHLKSRFGSAGATAAWLSDIGYVNIRFNLSPLFKGGEVEESLQFNAMNGVNPGGDPWVEALFYRMGVGDDPGVLTQELTYDQTLQGLSTLAGKSKDPAAARQAAKYVFYAKQAPETMAQRTSRAALTDQAEAHAAFLREGHTGYAESQHAIDVQIAELTDEAGNVIEGNQEHVDQLLETKQRLDDAEAWVAEVQSRPLADTKEDLLAQLRETVNDGSFEAQPGPRFTDDGVLILDTRRGFAADAIDVEARYAPGPEPFKTLGPGEPGISVRPDYSDVERTWVYRDAAGEPKGYAAVRLGGDGQPLSVGVYVDPALRREGIATSLYNAVRDDGYDLSAVSGLSVTAEGRAFTDSYWKPPSPAEGAPLPGLANRHNEILAKLASIDAADPAHGPQADVLEDVFGTPEHLTQIMAESDAKFLAKTTFDEPGFARKAWETLKNPIPLKQHQATLYRIEKLRRDFPVLVKAAGMDGFGEVMQELHVPERDWLPFLMADRALATDFHNSGSPEAFQALIDHAGPDARGKFDELYASEEWGALTGLFALADKTAADEAFRVHFFNPYRSAIERSINHPLMGIYPISWAYKAARQWAQFLYENRTFGELRLGMAPAVAINSIVRSQNIAFAQMNPESLQEYLSTRGPFGSTFMIFNLLLPGDWSTIPFPASRTIRDLVRGQFSANTLERNIQSLGALRDLRLGTELGGEVRDFVWGPEGPDANKPLPPWTPHSNVPAYAPSTLGTEPAFR